MKCDMLRKLIKFYKERNTSNGNTRFINLMTQLRESDCPTRGDERTSESDRKISQSNPDVNINLKLNGDL